MPYYIGISNGAHDPAIAIVNPNGELLFAEALERFFQQKRAWDIASDHWQLLEQIIPEYCDPEAEFVLASSWSSLSFTGKDCLPSPASSNPSDFLSGQFPDRNISPFLQPESEIQWLGYSQRQAFQSCGQLLKNLLWHRYGNKQLSFRQYDHHLCHAAMACYSSKFNDALCLIVDGEGEIGAATAFEYRNGQLQRLQRSWGPGSLGAFYSKITELCGFNWRKGDEGKIMGLVAYGQRNDVFIGIMDKMLRIDGCRIIFPKTSVLNSLLQSLQSEIAAEKMINPEVVADLAFAGQFVFEQKMTALISNLYEKGNSTNLVLGGGCALNSAFNGKILKCTPFQDVHVPCAPGDDGNAVGAAFLAYLSDHPSGRSRTSWKSAFLGSPMKKTSFDRLVRFYPSQYIGHYPGTVHQEVARCLAEGKIVGWVQGRAEFGPRALGNRSILADPRAFDMKDLINNKVKFREDFRPFAPAILEEHVDEWFDRPTASPYMSFTACWKKNSLAKIPAVVHQDNTGRLQTVSRANNIKYYDLISAFYEITGVPIVLNTSFNIMGKPIIHDIENAVAVLYTTGLDCLCIGDYLISKDTN